MKDAWLAAAVIAAITILGFQPLRTAGADKEVSSGDLPAAVTATVARKYPGARIAGAEKEKGAYEVELVEPTGEEVAVLVSAEGKILEEERSIPVGSLPEAVKAGLAGSPYRTWTVSKAERVVIGERADDPTFELAVRSGTKKGELVIDRAGKILAEKIKDR